MLLTPWVVIKVLLRIVLALLQIRPIAIANIMLVLVRLAPPQLLGKARPKLPALLPPTLTMLLLKLLTKAPELTASLQSLEELPLNLILLPPLIHPTLIILLLPMV